MKQDKINELFEIFIRLGFYHPVTVLRDEYCIPTRVGNAVIKKIKERNNLIATGSMEGSETLLYSKHLKATIQKQVAQFEQTLLKEEAEVLKGALNEQQRSETA